MMAEDLTEHFFENDLKILQVRFNISRLPSKNFFQINTQKMTRFVMSVIREFMKSNNDDEKRSLPMIQIVPLILSHREKYFVSY